MAQRSKKDQVALAALPLFLENGFKGTSIDMVVKASKVSKATVYNHFPDKAALMLATMILWVDANKPQIVPVGSIAEFDELVRKRWLSDETLRLYALVIGEGWRFPRAKRLFWDQFDRLWREALAYLSKHSDVLDASTIEMRLDHQMLQRLKLL